MMPTRHWKRKGSGNRKGVGEKGKKKKKLPSGALSNVFWKKTSRQWVTRSVLKAVRHSLMWDSGNIV